MSPALLATIGTIGFLACLAGMAAARALFAWADRRVEAAVTAALGGREAGGPSRPPAAADWDRWEFDPGIVPKRPRPYDQEAGR